MPGRKAGCWLLIGILFVAVLALPWSSSAHRRVRVGIGFGFWYPAWVHPYPYYHYPYYPPYYYPPVVEVPVRVAPPPPPPCRQVWVEGRWERIARDYGGGFSSYTQQWVPGRWERICP